MVCTFLLIVIAPSGACINPAGGGGIGAVTEIPIDGGLGGGGGQGGGGGAAGITGGHGGGVGTATGVVSMKTELEFGESAKQNSTKNKLIIIIIS